MPTYEIFLKPAGRDGFTHAGSFDAPDDDLARIFARETYVRRGEGEQAWVVRRTNVIPIDEDDLEVTTHRLHTMNDGSTVARRRKQHRDDHREETR